MAHVSERFERPAPIVVAPALTRTVLFVVLAVALAIAYDLLAHWLAARGVVPLHLTVFAEKAALALHGAPPRLVNIGFVYPPLSFVLQLPFADPILAQATIAGIVIAALVVFFESRPIGATRRLVKLYLLTSPLVVVLAVQNYGALLFCALLAAGLWYLLRFLRNGYSLHLFVASTLIGLTFFVDFRGIALLAAIVPAIALPLWRRSRAQAISVAITICLPMAFFALAWMYVNWVFLNDPLAFVHARGGISGAPDASPALLAIAGDPLATLRASALFVIASLPVLIPYVVGFARLKGGPPAYLVPAAAVYAVPLLLVVSSLYTGSLAPGAANLVLFLFVTFFALEETRRGPLVTAALVIGFLASFAAPFFSPNAEERAFADALVGRPALDTLRPYREAAAHLEGAQHVLLDDRAAAPVVSLAGDAGRFILPYQYEFTSAISNPRAFADAVVIARRKDDMLDALYPDVERDALPGFREVFRNDAFIVLRREVRR